MMLDQAIQEFLEYLEVERNYSPLTIELYRRYLRRFSEWLAETDSKASVQDVDEELVRRYRLYLARLAGPSGEGLKKITQTYYLIALRALLRYLIVQRNLTALSPDRIQLPKTGSRVIKFLSSEEIERLLGSPDTSNITGLRDRAILEMLFSTGLRVSELTRLNREQIDLERKELGVIGKGSKARVVFLSESAAEWVGRYLRSREDYFRPLFIRYAGAEDISKDGERMRLTPRSVQRIVKKYGRMCHLQVKTSPHTLRHSFATDLLIAGADIRSVQEMLGHESITTTQVYTHVTDRHLKEVHRVFHGKSKQVKSE
ncbi:MAG: hypothetical protein FJ012_03215 [Chloroflexi bacterium]|nr:hypothetical protein [Chloroflexota bacterium]